MKRFVLLFAITLLTSLTAVQAQSERHPISTASIALMDGKTEILFEEGVNEHFSVEVRDLTGKSVYILHNDHLNTACYNVELPIENLKKGIYMVQITGASGKIKTLKLQRN